MYSYVGTTSLDTQYHYDKTTSGMESIVNFRKLQNGIGFLLQTFFFQTG